MRSGRVEDETATKVGRSDEGVVVRFRSVRRHSGARRAYASRISRRVGQSRTGGKLSATAECERAFASRTPCRPARGEFPRRGSQAMGRDDGCRPNDPRLATHLPRCDQDAGLESETGAESAATGVSFERSGVRVSSGVAYASTRGKSPHGRSGEISFGRRDGTRRSDSESGGEGSLRRVATQTSERARRSRCERRTPRAGGVAVLG